MPLVYVGAEAETDARSDAHARARKIRPEYTEGELVRVAGGRNQAEAELIQGLLIEEGVPSVLRRAPGFDVPDFLAAGPRDVLVPESGAEAARELLLGSERAPAAGGPQPERRPGRHAATLLAAILGGGLAAALLAWLLLQLAG